MILTLHYPEFQVHFRKLPLCYIQNINSNENQNILSYPELPDVKSRIIYSDDETC